MQIYDVAAYHIRGMVKGLAALDIDVDAVLREAQIDDALLNDPEARFSEPQMLQIWMAAERRWTRPEPFGLAVATHIPYGGLELIDYLIAACATVSEGIEMMVRYTRLCASGFYFTLERAETDEGPAMRVCLHHYYGIQLIPPGNILYLWGALIWRFREHGEARFRPLLHLRQPAPPDLEFYHRTLGRVSFGREHDEAYIPLDQWALENPRRDPMLSTLMARHADDVMERSVPRGDFLSAVTVSIADAMRIGDISIERVAKRIGMSERTLQRRLADDGVVFKQLVDDIRYQFARLYLTNSKLSLQQISELLGYSEQRAFQRAFRRWSGVTPATYRTAHHPDAPTSASEPACDLGDGEHDDDAPHASAESFDVAVRPTA